jgi:hypothetical protein
MQESDFATSGSNASLVIFPDDVKRTSSNSKNNYIVKICAVAGMANLLHAGISAKFGLG